MSTLDILTANDDKGKSTDLEGTGLGGRSSSNAPEGREHAGEGDKSGLELHSRIVRKVRERRNR